MNEQVRKKRGRARGRMGVSLDEVAARAKVSTASVSRVLNGVTTVSDTVRRQVEQACAELNYVPNGAARALAASRTMTIGAVVPTIENVGFATTVSYLQSALKAAGYTLLLASSDYEPKAELRDVRLLLSRGIDGLMLVGGEHEPEMLPLIQHHRVPFVETWAVVPDRPCVGVDNFAAAYALARHLVDLGHTEIGLISGSIVNNDRSGSRQRGVMHCLAERGLELRSQWYAERPYGVADGRTATRALILSPERPTAVICGNDQLALGAMIEAQTMGLSVPHDLSVAGFNDLEFAAQTSPSLTTVHIPASEIGLEAAKFLLRAIEGGDPVSVVTPFAIVQRGSTAVPPCGRKLTSGTKKTSKKKKK